MIEANASSYHIILMGSMGDGRSTVCNMLTGCQAPTADGTESVTKEPKAYRSTCHTGLTVIDTPGFGDPDISMRKWIATAARFTDTPIHAIVMVINATTNYSY